VFYRVGFGRSLVVASELSVGVDTKVPLLLEVLETAPGEHLVGIFPGDEVVTESPILREVILELLKRRTRAKPADRESLSFFLVPDEVHLKKSVLEWWEERINPLPERFSKSF
jgi:hypothetical protein